MFILGGEKASEQVPKVFTQGNVGREKKRECVQNDAVQRHETPY
jgi:hypothetical protein